MKSITHKLGDKTVIFQEVEKDEFNHRVFDDSLMYNFKDGWGVIPLEKGEWELIGFDHEMTEEKAKEIVEKTSQLFNEQWGEPEDKTGWEKVEFKDYFGKPTMMQGQYHKWKKAGDYRYRNYEARINPRAFILPSADTALESYASLKRSLGIITENPLAKPTLAADKYYSLDQYYADKYQWEQSQLKVWGKTVVLIQK